MTIYLFDKNKALMGEIKDVINYTQKQVLGGHITANLTAVYKPELETAFYFGSKDVDDSNIFWMYRVSSLKKEDGFATLSGIYLLFDELQGEVIRDIRPQNVVASSALTSILNGSSWQVGTTAATGVSGSTYYYQSRLSAFWDFIKKWQVEFKPRMTFSDGVITGRYIDIYNQISADYGKRYEYGDELIKVVAEQANEGVYTALIGLGKGEQVGDGFGRKINFSSEVWTTPTNPVNKPINQDYVEIPSATAMYGLRMGVIDFPDIDDKALLLKETYNTLLTVSRPRVEFSADAVETGRVEIGELVTVVRADLGIKYKTRVFEVERNFLDKTVKTFKFGDKVVVSSAERIKNDQRITDLKIRDNVSLLIRVREQIAQQYFGEDGYNYDLRTGNEYGLPAGLYSFNAPIDQNPTKVIYVGAGKMLISDAKDVNGEWIWKTAATPEGLVGSSIIANSITVNQLSSDVGQQLDISSNTAITSKVSNQQLTDALGNIVTGSRNLLLNSDFSKTVSRGQITNKHPDLYAVDWSGYSTTIPNPTTSWHAHIDNTTFSFSAIEFNESDGNRYFKAAGQTLTNSELMPGVYSISADVYGDGGGTKLRGGFYYTKIGDTVQGYHSGMFEIVPTKVRAWERLWAKVQLNDDVDLTKPVIFFLLGHNFTGNSILYTYKPMLAFGNVGNDWVRSIKETETRLTTAESSIEQNKSDITARVKTSDYNAKMGVFTGTIAEWLLKLDDFRVGFEKITKENLLTCTNNFNPLPKLEFITGGSGSYTWTQENGDITITNVGGYYGETTRMYYPLSKEVPLNGQDFTLSAKILTSWNPNTTLRFRLMFETEWKSVDIDALNTEKDFTLTWKTPVTNGSKALGVYFQIIRRDAPSGTYPARLVIKGQSLKLEESKARTPWSKANSEMISTTAYSFTPEMVKFIYNNIDKLRFDGLTGNLFIDGNGKFTGQIEASSGSFASGISNIGALGVSVGSPTSGINSKTLHNGFKVLDGVNTLFSAGETGVQAAEISAGIINGNVINTLTESLILEVGEGKTFSTISEAINSLVSKRHIILGRTITINVYGSIYDNCVIRDFSGSGAIYIRFQTGARLNGSIRLYDNSVYILIRGLASTDYATIKPAENVYPIYSSGNKMVDCLFLNLDGANASTLSGVWADYSTIKVANCDFSNLARGITLNNGSIGMIYDNRGNTTQHGYFVTSGSALFVRGLCPVGSYSLGNTYAFMHQEGTLTPTPSTYSPPAVTAQTFSSVFRQTRAYTEDLSSNYVSYYGNTAAQGYWEGDTPNVGAFEFSKDLYDYIQGATNIVIQIRVHRVARSHGNFSGATPKGRNFTPTGAFNSIGLDTWSSWVTIPTSVLVNGITKLTFYDSAVNSGYCIMDMAEIKATVTKNV